MKKDPRTLCLCAILSAATQSRHSKELHFYVPKPAPAMVRALLQRTRGAICTACVNGPSISFIGRVGVQRGAKCTQKCDIVKFEGPHSEI